ncbi:MAG: protein kinase domain-containing protein, partial [Gemmatimonadota bacterium]
PENIFVTQGPGGEDIPKLLDFGIAKVAGNDGQNNLTRTGTIFGTPFYMAPEQVASDPTTDHRADLYALGVMAYEMLTGRTPFAERGVTEIMQAHLVETPEPLTRHRPTTPAALAGLVMRCLEKDPAHRPQDAASILAVLDDPAVVSGAVSSESLKSLPNATRRPPVRWLVAGALAVVVIAGAMLALRGRTGPASAASGAAADAALPPGVAVLPMVSVSPDSSDAYLALGMTDEITGALSRVPGLRVASRSAAEAAQAAGGTVGDVARRLGVPYLLEGTVQRNGDRIRVAVRLVTAADGFSAWSEVYERPTGDLLAVQADIASQIAAAVQDDVSMEARLDVSGARDPEAYNDFLRGHYQLSRRTPESLPLAVEAFESAVARDPAFAKAYAELAQSYALLPAVTDSERAESIDKATYAAQRALALDSTVAEAHAALGSIHSLEWRWREADQAYRRALALDSSEVSARVGLAVNAMVNGDARGAEVLLVPSARRNATGASARHPALAQSIAGSHDAAIATARAAVVRDSTTLSSRRLLATVLLQAGRFPEAIAQLESIRGEEAESPEVLGALGYALGRVGRASEARSIVMGLQRDTRRAGVYPAMAIVYLGLGEKDAALDALTWATAARDAFFSTVSMASE